MTTDRFGETLIDRQFLEAHLAYVAGENSWQQRARLLQSLWREDHDYPPGSRARNYVDPDADRLGSRLDPATAAKGANFVTPNAWARAQYEVDHKEPGALMSKPRLLHDLLSSQPLCFNLFAELDADHALATAVLRDLLPGLGITGLTPGSSGRAIRFEHSPGRGRPEYGGDHSAFDVAISFESDRGPGLLGIEVKYHEDLTNRDDTEPNLTGWFDDVDPASRPQLVRPPLVQLARDHRLARAVAREDSATYPAGATWVLLYPAGNTAVARAFDTYQQLLPAATDMAAVTVDAFVAACERHTTEPWPAALRARYLDTDRATNLGTSSSGTTAL